MIQERPGQKISVAKLLDRARESHTEKMETFSDSPNTPSTVAANHCKSMCRNM